MRQSTILGTRPRYLTPRGCDGSASVNAPSDGQERRIDVGAFLIRAGNPAKQGISKKALLSGVRVVQRSYKFER